MKRRTKQILTGLLAVFIVMILTFFYFSYSEKKEYKRKGNELITKVERFREAHGKLPESVDDIYLTKEMGEGPYYQKIDDTTYTVYFNIGFDNTFTYQSAKGEWEYGK
jgi:glycogen debranching enzyme